MNFLKKKIKNVVHGKRNKDDDDDDFDNYVPAVPPHPSTLAPENNNPNGTSSNDSFVANFSSFNFDSITSAADTAAKSLVSTLSGAIPDPLNPLASTGEQEESEPPKPISLEELKTREEEHKRAEKEKLRQQEETKKDSEDWKYFLSLTAKVDTITSKTQSVLTKLKDESAINEISNLEDPCFADRFDESAPKTAGGWIAFEESEGYNPADPIFTEPPPQEVTEEVAPVEPVIDEGTQQLAQELIDAFGFTNPAPGIPALIPEKTVVFDTEEENVDPFDTSFIDVDAIKSGKAIDFTEQNTDLIKDLDWSDNTSFDPFDTTHVETVISTDLVDTVTDTSPETN